MFREFPFFFLSRYCPNSKLKILFKDCSQKFPAPVATVFQAKYPTTMPSKDALPWSLQARSNCKKTNTEIFGFCPLSRSVLERGESSVRTLQTLQCVTDNSLRSGSVCPWLLWLPLCGKKHPTECTRVHTCALVCSELRLQRVTQCNTGEHRQPYLGFVATLIFTLF